MIVGHEDIGRKLSEATKGTTALNGAGIAGIIALIQSFESIPMIIRISGGLFLLGLFMSIVSWAMGEPFGGENEDAVEHSAPAVYLNFSSLIVFFIATLTAFVGVNLK